MNKQQLQGKWALITGASSGLGVDFAHDLAGRGCNLILVARRQERLEAVAQEVMAKHNVTAKVIAMDLGEPDAPQRLYDQVSEMGTATSTSSAQSVSVLINNAGFGVFGEFTEIPWEREAAMLNLDIVSLVHLTKLFVKDMVAADFGYVLQVSSIGAYQPSPLYASYSASKAFVLSFGEAINYELRDSNVSVTVLSPGVTRTEFLDVAGQETTFYQRMMMMESKDVVRIGLDAMFKGKASVIPGFGNWLGAWANRLIPRRAQTALAYRLMQ
jgi:short-subunit dehydrogenase